MIVHLCFVQLPSPEWIICRYISIDGCIPPYTTVHHDILPLYGPPGLPKCCRYLILKKETKKCLKKCMLAQKASSALRFNRELKALRSSLTMPTSLSRTLQKRHRCFMISFAVFTAILKFFDSICASLSRIHEEKNMSHLQTPPSHFFYSFGNNC